MKREEREPSKEREQSSSRARGIKKHAGAEETIVVEQDGKRRNSGETSLEQSADGSERTVDGRKEKYNDFTASELNKQK